MIGLPAGIGEEVIEFGVGAIGEERGEFSARPKYYVVGVHLPI